MSPRTALILLSLLAVLAPASAGAQAKTESADHSPEPARAAARSMEASNAEQDGPSPSPAEQARLYKLLASMRDHQTQALQASTRAQQLAAEARKLLQQYQALEDELAPHEGCRFNEQSGSWDCLE